MRLVSHNRNSLCSHLWWCKGRRNFGQQRLAALTQSPVQDCKSTPWYAQKMPQGFNVSIEPSFLRSIFPLMHSSGALGCAMDAGLATGSSPYQGWSWLAQPRLTQPSHTPESLAALH